MKNKIFIITVMVALIFGGGGFFGGMKYQQTKNPRFGNFQGARGGQMTQRNQGLRPVNGEIISADDKSITVKLADDSSKIIFLTESAAINKSEKGTKEDLKAGEKVVVFGQENADGSLTAQNIQLNPVFRGTPAQ
jgi:hypothetical protein